jgi:hypothetical protein
MDLFFVRNQLYIGLALLGALELVVVVARLLAH